MLLMSIILKDTDTYFVTPSVTAGTSPNIKVHALFSKSTSFLSLVIINKDTNSSTTGNIFLNSSSSS